MTEKELEIEVKKQWDQLDQKTKKKLNILAKGIAKIVANMTEIITSKFELKIIQELKNKGAKHDPRHQQRTSTNSSRNA